MDNPVGGESIRLGHKFHDTGALANGLEELPDIAFGPGRVRGALDHFLPRQSRLP